MSGVDSVWASKGVADTVASLDSEPKTAEMRRRVEFVRLGDANHFVRLSSQPISIKH